MEKQMANTITFGLFTPSLSRDETELKAINLSSANQELRYCHVLTGDSDGNTQST